MDHEQHILYVGIASQCEKLVFGNGMISASLLYDLGIQYTEKLILDQYHLKED